MIGNALHLKTRSPAHSLRLNQSGIHAALMLASITMLLPFVFMVLSSFKTFGEAIAVPPVLFPKAMAQKVLSGEKEWTYLFNNYTFLFGKVDYFPALFRNTMLLIAGRIFCAVTASSLAAYAFAKLQFPFKKQLFGLVLIQLMLPDQVFLVPQFKMVVAMGWVNTIPGLIFPGLVSAFGTFFLRQYYMGLPDELSESAKIDGCGHGRIFLRILFPMTKTPVMALSIFTAVFAWSNLMWPLIVNSENRLGTLASILAKIQMMSETFKPQHFMAASVITMLPMIILYLIFQRQFVEGIALTGLKA
jgi:multiple sugar transport system permease protein